MVYAPTTNAAATSKKARPNLQCLGRRVASGDIDSTAKVIGARGPTLEIGEAIIAPLTPGSDFFGRNGGNREGL
jgi:hypothetical protein